jgi:multicomponent Na+:H+ antiporter subunit G
LIVLALLPRAGDPLIALKLILSWLLIQLSGAVVTQLLARAALGGSSKSGLRR